MELVSPEIEDYCRQHTTAMGSVFTLMKEQTEKRMGPAARMQVGSLEGAFLKFLIAASGAKTVLELGTFTGFSALAMAEGLPADGRVITCDIDPNATALAKEFWARSPHGSKIELRLGPGLQSIEQIQQPLDFVFIDADKAGYISYWEACITKLSRHGIIVIDNVLWSGRVLQPQETSDHHIVAFNRHAMADARMEIVMLPVRDGMLLARRRET